MLENLHIKNVALIEECQVSFGAGLNILTGETGAGKSMLIDSLQFALGGRTGKDFLRRGQKMASVAALFSVADTTFSQKLIDLGIEPEEDHMVLIHRTYSDSGKSVCRINGNMVSVSALREISSDLIDFYGQHEHQSLLNPSKHIQILDRFCGEKFEQALQAYQEAYAVSREVEKQLQALFGDDGERERKIDLLSFQKEEIEMASLKIGEEEELQESKKRLGNMERLMRVCAESVEILYEGSELTPSVCDAFGNALVKLREGAELDSELELYYTKMEEIYAELEDCARDVRKYTQQLENEPEELESIEERLELIYKLKRKYGKSVQDVLTYYAEISEELEFLSDSEDKIAKLHTKKEQAQTKMLEFASILTKERKQTAERISQGITQALHDMEMQQAKFEVSIVAKDDFSANGLDKVEFLISPNRGEDMKPLSKIASGGEMSRVMLALKAVLVDGDEIETFVFDEIDTGVSGKTAGRVGEKMHVIGKTRQILCITHLPQIAAMADSHYLIEKETIEEKTFTKVMELDEEKSIQEVARLMGGISITEATLLAARELRSQKK